jgi:hypothetical protein
MFTRMSWQPPTVPQSFAPDVQKYLRELNKSIDDYLRSLEAPGGTVLDELKAWTPVDVSGASLSFTSVTGTYLVVGRLVFAWGALTYPATASGANAAIGGLPLKVKAETAARGGGIMGNTTETTAARIVPVGGDTYVNIATNAGALITNATMSGDTVVFCAIYPY